MGEARKATAEEKLAALRVCKASAEDNDGVPVWIACERATGWSRTILRRWWLDVGNQKPATPPPPRKAPAPPKRTALSVKPGGKVAQLPPPAAEEVDDTPAARAVPPPTWGDLDEADYCLRELDTLWRLREGARMAEQYSATAPLTDRIERMWRALRAEIAKRAERTGRTPEQVRADLIDRAAKMSDTLLEPFVVEWRRRHGGAA
jgi:hypothetical protein